MKKAKDEMRELFRKTLKLSNDTDIEFTRSGSVVTITQIPEKKPAKKSNQDLSDLF